MYRLLPISVSLSGSGLILSLEEVSDLSEENLILSRCRRSSLLLLDELVHHLNDKEDAEGDDKEVDHSLEEETDLDNGLISIEAPRDNDMKTLEVDTAYDSADNGHEHIINESGNDACEGRSDDHTNSEIHNISL